MPVFDDFDWSRGSPDQQLAVARKGTDDQLRALARIYDWKWHPETVLGWVMAQKGIDLSTALCVFLKGEPELFNYMPKRDVPAEYRGAARVLDNICLRVNSGFYLAYPERDVRSLKRVQKWLAFQAADRAEGRRGRWILDEQIVSILLEDSLRFDRSHEASLYHDKPSLLRDIFSPVMELGVSRRVMRMLPRKITDGGSRID